MLEIRLTIHNKVGLHARSAALFAQTARQYASKITVWNQGRSADATDVVRLVTLGVYQGTEVVVKAAGSDAGPALAALQQLVENNFGEPL